MEELLFLVKHVLAVTKLDNPKTSQKETSLLCPVSCLFRVSIFLYIYIYIKLKTYNTYYLVTLPTKNYTLLLRQYHLERKITSTKWQHKTKNTNIALHVTTLKDKDST